MKKFFVLFLVALLIPALIGCSGWGGDDDDGVPATVTTKTVGVWLPATAGDALSLRAATQARDVKLAGTPLSYKKDGKIDGKNFEFYTGNIPVTATTTTRLKLEYKTAGGNQVVRNIETKSVLDEFTSNKYEKHVVTMVIKGDKPTDPIVAVACGAEIEPQKVYDEKVTGVTVVKETKNAVVAANTDANMTDTEKAQFEKDCKALEDIYQLKLVKYTIPKAAAVDSTKTRVTITGADDVNASGTTYVKAGTTVTLVSPAKKSTLDDYKYEPDKPKINVGNVTFDAGSEESKSGKFKMPKEDVELELVWKAGEVAPAILHNATTTLPVIADADIAQNYYLTQGDGTQNGGNKIYVYATNVKKHTVNNVVSNWVGVAFLAPDNATQYKAVVASDTMPDQAKIEAAAAKATAVVTKDGIKGYAKHWKKESQQQATVWFVGIQWLDNANKVISVSDEKYTIFKVYFKDTVTYAN